LILYKQARERNTSSIQQAEAALKAKQAAGQSDVSEQLRTIQAFEGQTAGLIHLSNALSSYDHREQISSSDLLTALHEAGTDHSIDLGGPSPVPLLVLFEEIAESVAARLNAKLFESAVCGCGHTTQEIQGFFGDVRNHIEDCPQCGKHTFHTGEDYGKCLSCGYWSRKETGKQESGACSVIQSKRCMLLRSVLRNYVPWMKSKKASGVLVPRSAQ
jgi:ribosomal protein L37E